MLLSACGGKDASTGDADSGSDQTRTKQEPVELVIYYPFIQDWSEEDFLKTFAEPIKQKFPHISIKYIAGGPPGTKIEELLAAGQKFDIVFHSFGANVNLWDYGLQYDISPLIKKFNYDLNKIDPALIDIQKKLGNGGIYGLPVYVPPSTVYYNKDIFDKFGVPYPKDGHTWDDLYEMSKRLTREDGGVQYQAIGTSHAHFFMLNQWSIPLVDTASKKATFDTDSRWSAFFENLVRFYKIPGHELKGSYINNPDERNRFFKNRHIAMFLMLTALASEKELEGMNCDLAAFPVFKDRPNNGPQAYPVYFYVSSNSDHKDQAFQVIATVLSEEVQTLMSRNARLPILTGQKIQEEFGKNLPYLNGKNLQAAFKTQPAKALPATKYSGIGQQLSQEAFTRVMKEGVDINTALSQADEKLNKQIEASK